MFRQEDRRTTSTPTCGTSAQIEWPETLKMNTRTAFPRGLAVDTERPMMAPFIDNHNSEDGELSSDNDKRHNRSASLDSAEKSTQKVHEVSLRKSLFLRKKQTLSSKHNSVVESPKIIITPANDERLQRKATLALSEGKPHISFDSNDLDMTPKSSAIGKLLRKKSTKKNTVTSISLGIRNRQSLTRQNSQRVLKSESGRLVEIIAKQALFGRHTDASKTFKTALSKVNKRILHKVSLEHRRHQAQRFKGYLKKLRRLALSFFGPWKPYSVIVLIWKSIILILIIVQTVVSTYIISFLPDSQLNTSHPAVAFDMSVDFIYALDILVNFKIAFYKHGELCLEPSEIAIHYLKSFFIMDLASEISLVGRFTPFRALILFNLIRVLRIPQIVAKVEDYFQFSRQLYSVFQLMKLLVLLVIFAHWCGCILYYVAITDSSPVNWIVEAGLSLDNLNEIYVASLYWSVATMATIGYGDIHPTTYRERILSIVVMLCSSVIFGYVLSSIGTLLIEINAFNSESREKIRLLTMYMREKGLSKDIQSKIRRYLEFYLNKENAMKMKGDSVLQLLSTNLKEEIFIEVNAKILDNSYMFSSNFRKKFLYLISKDLVEMSLAPDEMVFYQGDIDDCSVYFITSGNVQIFYDKCIVEVQKLNKGENFGGIAFFSGSERTANAKSIEFATVFKLKRERFLERLENFPSEKETYCMIKDNINIYSNYQYLDLRCYSCGSLNHITLHCYKFHAIFDKSEIISEYLEESEDFRRGFRRRRRRKFHYLRDTDIIHEAASQVQIIQHNELYCETMVTDRMAHQYSDGEDILDKNIYNPQPIVYNVETVQTKTLNIQKEYRTYSSILLSGSPMERPRKKTAREAGSVKSFVVASYDPLWHNLNLDRVKNFEVYYPNNNIAKLLIEMEEARLEKMIQMRLQGKAKHIYPLLVKSFRMNERRKESILFQRQSSISLTVQDSSPPGRKSISKSIPGVNPSDITFYSSAKKGSVDFGQHSPVSPGFLNVESPEKKYQTLPVVVPKSNGSLGTILNPHSIVGQRRRSSRLGENTKLSLFAAEQDEANRERNSSATYTFQDEGSRLKADYDDLNNFNSSDHSDLSSDSGSEHVVSQLNYRLGEIKNNKSGSLASKDSLGLSKTPTTPKAGSALSSNNKGNIFQKQQDSLKQFGSSDKRLASSREGSVQKIPNSKSGSVTAVRSYEIDDSGVLDFSKHMKKISGKLEENSSPVQARGRAQLADKIMTEDLTTLATQDRVKKAGQNQKVRSISEDTAHQNVKKAAE